METLLAIDPDDRGTALAALNSEVSGHCDINFIFEL